MAEEKQITEITSKFLSLQTRDFIRGLMIAVIAPVFTVLQNSIAAEQFVLNWRAIGITALSAGMAYLAKNFFEPAKTIYIVKPPDPNVPSGEKTISVD